MADVVAFNKRGERRVFSEYCWKLLGNNTEGWTAESSQPIVNQPPTGQKVVVHASVEDEKIEVPNLTEAKGEKDGIEPKAKERFIESLSVFNKSFIKDYFDKNGVEYKNGTSIADLRARLAEVLNYSEARRDEIL